MNDSNIPRVKEADLANSMQLIPGQKFHHCGKNGVVYFQLQVESAADGSVYPMTTTARAANVLPIECDENGEVIAAYFLVQQGRPEMQSNEIALKSVGSFSKPDEESADTALRSLSEKLNIQGSSKNLIFVGQSYGFGDQFCFPIDLFVLKEYSIMAGEYAGGCERVRMTLEDIAVAQQTRAFFNSETIDLIATILLRNQFRDAYTW